MTGALLLVFFGCAALAVLFAGIFILESRRAVLRVKVGDISIEAGSEDTQALLKLARQFHDFSLDR